MRDIEVTKLAQKKLKKLFKSDIKLAKQIVQHIEDLQKDLIQGEILVGYSDFRKIRVRHFRIIYTMRDDEAILIAIIDKRETVYQSFEHQFKNSDLI